MSTGVTASDEATAAFAAFKQQSNKTVFMTFFIDTGGTGKIEVEHQSEDANFATFQALLPENQCRYAVYKRSITTADGRPTEKLVSITWYFF